MSVLLTILRGHGHSLPSPGWTRRRVHGLIEDKHVAAYDDDDEDDDEGEELEVGIAIH